MAGEWAIVAAGVGAAAVTVTIPALLQARAETKRSEREVETAAAAQREARFEEARDLYLDVVRIGGQAVVNSASTATAAQLAEKLAVVMALGSDPVRAVASAWLLDLDSSFVDASNALHLEDFVKAVSTWLRTEGYRNLTPGQPAS
jgi:hypothetical protein